MKQFSNLQKSDFEKILQEYSIGKYKSHKYLEWTLDNYVYIFKTTKGKFILKILKKINYKKYLKQLEFIDYLESKKIPVAKNIHSNNGNPCR